MVDRHKIRQDREEQTPLAPSQCATLREGQCIASPTLASLQLSKRCGQESHVQDFQVLVPKQKMGETIEAAP